MAAFPGCEVCGHQHTPGTRCVKCNCPTDESRQVAAPYILNKWPPNIKQIRDSIGKIEDTAIFAWGPNKIYVPSGLRSLPPELIAHEQVHFRQQGDDPKGWWDEYLDNERFRLEQEVEAHQAEWKAYRGKGRRPKEVRRFLGRLANRLSGPMYGDLVTPKQAVKLILGRKDDNDSSD